MTRPLDQTESPMRSRLLGGGAWALSGKITTMLVVVLTNALLARILTPEELGVYFIVLSVVAVAAMTSQLGMNYSVVRLIAESIGLGNKARARLLVLKSLFIVGITAAILGLIFVAGMGRWVAESMMQSPLMVTVTGLAAIWVVTLSVQMVLAEVFRGFHDIRWSVLTGGLLTGGAALACFSIIWAYGYHADLRKVMLICIGSVGLNLMIALTILSTRMRTLSGHASLTVRELLTVAWPAWITTVTLLVVRQIDIWILGAFLPKYEVAVYAAASKVADVISLPLVAVNAVVPPMIAELYVRIQRAELASALSSTATLALIPTVIAVLVIAFFSDSLLGFVYGPYYKQGSLVLVLFAIGHLVNVWAGSCGLTLLMTGHQVSMMVISIVSGLLLVVGSLIVVRPFGTVGVACVSVSVMGLQNLLAVVAARLYVGVWTNASNTGLKELLRIWRSPQGG